MTDIIIQSAEANETAKAQSLDQMRRDVITAFDAEQSYDMWIAEIWDEYVIARDNKAKTHWKITYTRDGSDITFAPKNQWQEVKLNQEWVQKAWSIKNRLAFDDWPVTGEEDMVKPANNAIKALGGNRLGFYGMMWGDLATKDVHGEFFTPETDGLTELFDQLEQLPFTYHHAADPTVKSFVFGMLDTMTPDDIGMWCEVQITKHKQYKQFIKPLVDDASLYPSSETLVGAKMAKSTGEITRWVTSFMTGTTSPAEWRLMKHPIDEIKGYFKSTGLAFPTVEGDKESDDMDDGNTAKGVEETQRMEMLIEIEAQRIQLLQLENK